MSNYGVDRYGQAVYGANLFPRAKGSRSVSARLFRATIDNVLVEDISDLFRGGSVSFSLDRDVHMAASITVDNPGRIDPYRDYLAPFIHVIDDTDGTDHGEQQLGLFALSVPPGAYDTRSSQATFVGDDLTSVLLGSAYSDAENVTGATKVADEVVTVCGEAGMTRVSVPPSNRTFVKTRSFKPGTSRLAKLNQMADFSGWYRPYASLDGRIVQEWTYREPSKRQPTAKWTSADIVKSVEVQPTPTVPRNVVIVVKDNPSDAPLVGTARNDDPSSPSSTASVGLERVRVESTSEAQTQADVDAIAANLLASERLRYRSASFTIFGLPVLTAYDTVRLTLDGELAPFSGLWAVRGWQFGFDPANAILTVAASQTLDEAGNVL